jgi:hypothetical protein
MNVGKIGVRFNKEVRLVMGQSELNQYRPI